MNAGRITSAVRGGVALDEDGGEALVERFRVARMTGLPRTPMHEAACEVGASREGTGYRGD